MSRPSGARGLKRVGAVDNYCLHVVAPFRGAWIETARSRAVNVCCAPSRPSGARGLKRHNSGGLMFVAVSRPSGARGLKQPYSAHPLLLPRSRPSGARGLKRFGAMVLGPVRVVAPFRGAWIETRSGAWIETFLWSRALQGRVD